MTVFSNSKLNLLLQGAIIFFTIGLFWFSFIYYPKMAYDLTNGNIIPKPTVFKPVVAQSGQLPIQTATYRVSWEPRSSTYYVFVNGNNLDEFDFNKGNAKLALKNALSAEKLCTFNVIYVSTAKLSIPAKYLDNADC